MQGKRPFEDSVTDDKVRTEEESFTLRRALLPSQDSLIKSSV